MSAWKCVQQTVYTYTTPARPGRIPHGIANTAAMVCNGYPPAARRFLGVATAPGKPLDIRASREVGFDAVRLQVGFCRCKCVSLVVVVFPHEAVHEERAGLQRWNAPAGGSGPPLHPCPAACISALTLWAPQQTVARTQNTPVTMDPFANAAIVLMIPAEPVLGIPMSEYMEKRMWKPAKMK